MIQATRSLYLNHFQIIAEAIFHLDYRIRIVVIVASAELIDLASQVLIGCSQRMCEPV